MAYQPSQAIIDAKAAYDKAIARYNDWVFNNKNLPDGSCIVGGQKFSAEEALTKQMTCAHPSSPSNVTSCFQACEELKFINSDVRPDLINKYGVFKSLADADPNYSAWAAGEAAINIEQQKTKKIWTYAIVTIIIIVIGVFVYRKFIRK